MVMVTMAKHFLLLTAYGAAGALAFTPHPLMRGTALPRSSPFQQARLPPLGSAPEPANGGAAKDAPAGELSTEEAARVGNLVADEEWEGLSMELAEAVRTAVVEDLKKNSRNFLGKEDYAVGDFSKEVDRRVKEEVAKIREKDDYELGDLSVVLDGKVKELVCELSGKEEYEFGDLSIEIDKRVKQTVAQFCGKDSYQVGDLSKEIAKRTKAGITNFTGKEDYQFGDLTKTAFKNYTGKDDYEFGDVTKKLVGNLFSGKKNKKEGK